MNQHYEFVIKKVPVKDKHGNSNDMATIYLKDTRDGFMLPHPVTDFIRSEFGMEYNTQNAAAQAVKMFLNYAFIEQHAIFGLKSFGDLTVSIGEEYLRYCIAQKNSLTTLQRKARYITHFYFFLTKKKILREVIDFKQAQSLNGSISLLSIFTGVKFPKKEVKEDRLRKFDDSSLISDFIQCSLDVAPEIALGIYLQFFGGLRRGEVVNVVKSDFEMKGPYAKEGLVVVVRDNQPLLFSEIKDVTSVQIKNPRRQVIGHLTSLPQLVKIHFDFLTKNSNHLEALFVNSEGKPMTGQVYSRRFEKVKKEFIRRLKEQNSPHAYLLEKKDWSTHIGRAIFTNELLSTKITPSTLAAFRGDSNTASALTYISESQIQQEVQKGLHALEKEGKFGAFNF